MGRKRRLNHRWTKANPARHEVVSCTNCGIVRAIGRYHPFGTGQVVEYSTPKGEIVSRGPRGKAPPPLCDPALYEGK